MKSVRRKNVGADAHIRPRTGNARPYEHEICVRENVGADAHIRPRTISDRPYRDEIGKRENGTDREAIIGIGGGGVL